MMLDLKHRPLTTVTDLGLSWHGLCASPARPPEPCQASPVAPAALPDVGRQPCPAPRRLPSLASLDLSHFCCWTEDLIPALKDHPAASLARLDLLSASSAEGFHVSELAACPNLRHFLTPYVFNPCYLDFVGDASLFALATTCPHLSLLHLIDPSTLSPAHPVPDPANDVLARNDSGITATGLESLFTAPPPPPPSHGSTSSPPPPPRASTPPSSPLAPTSATSSPPVFNPRYLDFVGDASLLSLAAASPSSTSLTRPPSPLPAPSLTLPTTSSPVTTPESLPLGSKASSPLSPTSSTRTSPSISATTSGMPVKHGPWPAVPASPIPKRAASGIGRQFRLNGPCLT